LSASMHSSLATREARSPLLTPGDYRRAGLLLTIAVCEILLATLLFKFAHNDSTWVTLVYSVNQLARAAFIAGCAFVIIAWAKRDSIARYWTDATRGSRLPFALGINLVVFASAMLAKMHLSSLDPEMIAPIWYWAYPAAILASAVSLALLLAPLRFWRRLVASFPGEVLLSVGVAVLAAALAILSKESWATLSTGTLALSYGLLSLYETDVFIDTSATTLGVGDFHVQIISACSGYEGIALVATFLAVFLVAFRSHLRFPQALILFPVAIAASWLLNSVRIAALVSLGAHVSPQMALDGFHSWAGWIAFLAIAATTMYGATRSRFLWRAPASSVQSPPARSDDALELLSPLIALLLAGIITGTMKPFDQWAYAVKVAAIGAVLTCFWRYYARYLASPSFLAVAVGVIVGVAWQATEPSAPVTPELAHWFSGLSLGWAALWLTLRGLGSVVLVPIAEELAFRGYLLRALSSALPLSPRTSALLALVVSSAAFGLLHERWLAGMLAGLAYGLLVQKSGRLQDAIAAHMASNAVLFLGLTAQVASAL
jgi:exosortase E/protease (VPEID-CTERM system)